MLSVHLTVAVLLVPGFIFADLEALRIEPSRKWYGIDGNWSSIGLLVGEPAQHIDVTVSTSLSEIWVVEAGGCGPSALCAAARGNVFNISESNSWSSLGAWQLGLDYLGLGGNGDYAMDTMAVHDSVKKVQTTFKQQVVAGVNSTDYYTGFFGLGITPGRFKSTVVQSPIAALVEQDSIIPSHSYGYTAGAYYRGGEHGTPLSLTLGGYDQNRFIPHATSFSLNATTRLPEALIRGITGSANSVAGGSAWSVPLQLLSFNESVTAIIDSSTPYLWLPTTICDRFASALNLTWNETFGLYLFSDNAAFDQISLQDLSFTFILSSADNQDNFGEPFDTPGVVNISVSTNAFAQTLRYPFMNAIQYGDAAIPYFPLKRVEYGNQVILGRSFLQESYLVANYETGTFSIYQALFPDDPFSNISIVTITAANNSPYPGTAETSDAGAGLTKNQIVGIVVGACVFAMAVIVIVWWVRRRKNRKSPQGMEEELKKTESSIEPTPPRSPVSRILSLFTKKCLGKKFKMGNIYEVDGNSTAPAEVAADSHHTRHELPVAVDPVELDATDTISINETTEFGTEEILELGAYEVARRKMEKQLQGPVPEYTPVASPMEDSSNKGLIDISHVAHYRPSDHLEARNPSPASTPTYDNSTYGLPSPITPHTPPHGDWYHPMPDFPSHITLTIPSNTIPRSNTSTSYSPHSPNTLEVQSMARSDSNSASPNSPASPSGSLTFNRPAIQRTPIDTSKIVCLGPLPDNVRLAHRGSTPQIIAPDGQKFAMPTIPSTVEYKRESGVDSLGSNYTIEQTARHNGKSTGQGIARGCSPIENHSPIESRIDGADLVHVPQPAEKRFSWEDDQ